LLNKLIARKLKSQKKPKEFKLSRSKSYKFDTIWTLTDRRKEKVFDSLSFQFKGECIVTPKKPKSLSFQASNGITHTYNLETNELSSFVKVGKENVKFLITKQATSNEIVYTHLKNANTKKELYFYLKPGLAKGKINFLNKDSEGTKFYYDVDQHKLLTVNKDATDFKEINLNYANIKSCYSADTVKMSFEYTSPKGNHVVLIANKKDNFSINSFEQIRKVLDFLFCFNFEELSKSPVAAFWNKAKLNGDYSGVGSKKSPVITSANNNTVEEVLEFLIRNNHKSILFSIFDGIEINTIYTNRNPFVL
jgi:hypothetical protein